MHWIGPRYIPILHHTNNCFAWCTSYISLLHYKMLTIHFVCLQYIVESARQRPAKRRASSSGRKSLYQKLYELYTEECEKEPELKVESYFFTWLFFCDIWHLSNEAVGLHSASEMVCQFWHVACKLLLSHVLFLSCRSWEEMSICLRSW